MCEQQSLVGDLAVNQTVAQRIFSAAAVCLIVHSGNPLDRFVTDGVNHHLHPVIMCTVDHLLHIRIN